MSITRRLNRPNRVGAGVKAIDSQGKRQIGGVVLHLWGHIKKILAGGAFCLEKGRDTVGELRSAEICVSYMPSWKAKRLGEPPQEKVLLEL
jgi:hypothetical protein